MGDAFSRYLAPVPRSISENLEAWNFIKELSWWPMVHFLVPMTIYMNTRDFFFVMFLVYLNETYEAFASSFSDQSDPYFVESRMDSLFGDPLQGVFGCWIGELLMQCARWDYTLLPTNIYRNYKKMGYILKYWLQIAVLIIPLELTCFTFGDGKFSWGIIFTVVWYPLFLWIFTFWNKDDPVFFRRFEKLRKRKSAKDGRVLSVFMSDGYEGTLTQKQVEGRRNVFLIVWGAYVVVTVAFMFYRWTYPLLMMWGYQVASVIVLYIVREETITYRYFYVDNKPPTHKPTRE